MTEVNKSNRGRPRGAVSNNPASATLPRVRVTPDKLDEYQQTAKASGLSFSAWVRDMLDRGVKRTKAKNNQIDR